MSNSVSTTNNATASAGRDCPPTLHWAGGVRGSLWLIDQTLLPVELREIECPDVETVPPDVMGGTVPEVDVPGESEVVPSGTEPLDELPPAPSSTTGPQPPRASPTVAAACSTRLTVSPSIP